MGFPYAEAPAVWADTRQRSKWPLFAERPARPPDAGEARPGGSAQTVVDPV